VQNPESGVQRIALPPGPLRLTQRFAPGRRVLVVKVRYEKNSIGGRNGLRKGQVHEIRETKMLYLVPGKKSRWHEARDFEVIGEKEEGR
jgi:hypothetical protein